MYGAYNRCMSGLFMAAAILVGIALWGLVLFAVVRVVFRRLSRWNSLAGRYRAPSLPGVWQWSRQTIKVGGIRYRHCVRLAAFPDGLYVGGPGWLGHPPLRIPWPDMQHVVSSSFYGRPSVRVTVGSPPAGTLEFPRDVYCTIYERSRRDAPLGSG